MAMAGGAMPMRIVLPSPEYPPAAGIGGIATHTAAVAQALAKRGHEVAVVTRGQPARTTKHGVTIVRIPGCHLPGGVPRRNTLERLCDQVRIVAACRRFAPEVVHASEWEAWAWLIARLGRVPVVTHLATPTFLVDELNVGHPSGDTTVVRWMERDQARHSRKVYGPTRAIVGRVAPAWSLTPGSVDVVPDPVDVDATRQEGAGDASIRMPQRSIVFNGRMERRKGVDVLGQALPEVLNAHPDVGAVVVGRDTGAEGGQLMARFKKASAAMSDRVQVVGELSHPAAMAVVARATVVVLPSYFEAFGYVCVEAMALGRPVIATAGHGFDDIICDGVDGWLVPPGDADALAACLIERLADADELARVSKAASAAAERFRVDHLAPTVEAMLQRAAGIDRATSATR
jgi:glycogen(starch) synthase